MRGLFDCYRLFEYTFLLLPLLSVIISKEVQGTSELADSPFATDAQLRLLYNSTSCPSFNYFHFIWKKQCPAVVARDPRCVFNLPGDAQPSGSLNCATVEAHPFPFLHNLNAEELLELIRQRDAYGRPWCMLSLLYSPDCVFTAKVAAAFYEVAPLFPKLKVVAVDVSANTKGSDALISQYGIASTPVIALWENGFPRYRLYEDYSQLDALVKAIHTRTDLRSLSKNLTQNVDLEGQRGESDGAHGPWKANSTRAAAFSRHHPSKEEFLAKFHYLREDLGFDWYLLTAIVVLCLNIAYFVYHSGKAREFLQRVIVIPGVVGVEGGRPA